MSTRPTNTTRLATLAARRDQIAAQLVALEARTRTAARRADDRRKFLLGALVLRELENDQWLRGYVVARLPGFLTRSGDQALFADLMRTADTATSSGGEGV